MSNDKIRSAFWIKVYLKFNIRIQICGGDILFHYIAEISLIILVKRRHGIFYSRELCFLVLKAMFLFVSWRFQVLARLFYSSSHWLYSFVVNNLVTNWFFALKVGQFEQCVRTLYMKELISILQYFLEHWLKPFKQKPRFVG